MPNMMLGGSKGRSVSLMASEAMIAVRTLSRGPIQKRSLNKLAKSAMQKSSPEIVFQGEDITLWRSDQMSGAELKEVLADEEQIEFAGTALTMEDSNNPVAYTERVFLALNNDASNETVKDILNSLGENWRVIRRLTYGRYCYLLEPRKRIGQEVFERAMELVERSEVDRCHPEFLRERAFKSVYPEQWHLGKRVIDNRLIEQSANVDGAWTVSRGEGVTIAIIDNGIDTRHPEFNRPGKIVSEFDFTANIADARPKSPGDNHGTACAGVACASGIAGATGVAPDARLMPIRLSSALGSMDESDAIMWAVEKGADVISCSWGPRDGKWWDPADPQHDVFSPISDNSALAIDAALNVGRQGRGCVVCWAAGNGNESVDLDGYASHQGVTAVAACSDRGDRSVYSDMGDAIACTFPSNNFQFNGSPEPLTPGIWTVDRAGTTGYNAQQGIEGNYTSGFGGTSSACPGVAGTAALIMAVDPMASGVDVRQSIMDTADKIDPAGGNYNASGHSSQYGQGRVNAERAVYSRLSLS